MRPPIEDHWINQLTSRSLLLISGLIAFFLVSELRDVSQRIIALPEWKIIIQNHDLVLVLFFCFMVYDLLWIISSLLGLRALARNEMLQAQLAKQWLFQQPLLVQIIVFVEHGVLATLYVLLTGDAKRGTILGFLVVIHVLVALIFAPMMVRSPD